MDAVTFIRHTLNQVHQRLTATCRGLTYEQVSWRPEPHANNIGFILWHIARAEDRTVGAVLSRRGELWVSRHWHLQFGSSVESPPPGDKMGLLRMPIPTPDILMGYLDEVHRSTMRFLESLTLEDLDAAPSADQPQRTVAALLRHQITHKNNHHGQVDYIRGLQDPDWDLAPGTGMVQE